MFKKLGKRLSALWGLFQFKSIGSLVLTEEFFGDNDFGLADIAEDFLDDWQAENGQLSEDEIKEVLHLVEVFETRGRDDDEIDASELSFILDDFLEEYGLGQYEE